MKTCSIEGCESKHQAHGLCQKHGYRLKKYGSPDDRKFSHGPVEQRFWRMANKRGEDDCWEWSGNRLPKGYGVIGKGGKGNGVITAHRLSYTMHKGEIPPSMVVMHSCDNPCCVNPKHLSVGTYSDNNNDSVAKGRGMHRADHLLYKGGRSNPSAISAEVAKAILEDVGTDTWLAKKHGVSRETARKIKTGIHWICRE